MSPVFGARPDTDSYTEDQVPRSTPWRVSTLGNARPVFSDPGELRGKVLAGSRARGRQEETFAPVAERAEHTFTRPVAPNPGSHGWSFGEADRRSRQAGPEKPGYGYGGSLGTPPELVRRPGGGEIGPEPPMGTADEWGAETGRPYTRELSDEEWAKLSPQQQSLVQFNMELIAALDADRKATSGTANYDELIGQLGLSDDQEATLRPKGGGLVPLTRLKDLLTDGGGNAEWLNPLVGNGGDGKAGVPSPLEGGGKRKATIDDISDAIQAYISKGSESRYREANADWEAKKEEFKFADEKARGDFEYSFDALMSDDFRDTYPWSKAVEDLKKGGYDPADFQNYALLRSAQAPSVDGTDLKSKLKAWFNSGGE